MDLIQLIHQKLEEDLAPLCEARHPSSDEFESRFDRAHDGEVGCTILEPFWTFHQCEVKTVHCDADDVASKEGLLL